MINKKLNDIYNKLQLLISSYLVILLIFISLISLTTKSQGQNNIPLYQNLDVLKELLSKADTLSPFSETNDTIAFIS